MFTAVSPHGLPFAIYTKTGDGGETSLGDGSRVPKDHPRVAAYGSVDELNAVLGLLIASVPGEAESDLIRSIQNDLFDVGTDLCVPQTADEVAGTRLPFVQNRQPGWSPRLIDSMSHCHL